MAFLTSTDVLTKFEKDGFALIKNPFRTGQIESLADEVERYRLETNSALQAGFRNFLRQSKIAKEFATCYEIRQIVSTFLGATAIPVRSILFDKTPASNWYVTWHQDRSIAVEKRVDITGFGPWSVKDGVVHVQPPCEILEQIVSLRIHLDDCSSENGAIKFIAGTHQCGLIDPYQVLEMTEGAKVEICPAKRGDIILMRPLILHSSSKSEKPDARRVLHIEYSAATLPSGLNWAEA